MLKISDDDPFHAYGNAMMIGGGLPGRRPAASTAAASNGHVVIDPVKRTVVVPHGWLVQT